MTYHSLPRNYLSALLVAGALALSGCEKAKNIDNPTLRSPPRVEATPARDVKGRPPIKTIDGVIEMYTTKEHVQRAGTIFQDVHRVERFVLRTADGALLIKHPYLSPRDYFEGDRVRIEYDTFQDEATQINARSVKRIKD
ncbi:MAG: hypothetical protein AABY13_00290 [Nanoarchaeota archaeon]